jgi:prevent-host-death family protein
MTKTLPVSEVKTHLPSLLVGVEEREEEVVVTRNGRPAAVLLSYDEYSRMKATLEVLSDADTMDQIHRSQRFFASRRKPVSFEDVFEESLPGPRSRRRDR